MLVVHVDMVQALALAVCTYYFGVWLKHVIPVLERFSVPSPVVAACRLHLFFRCLKATA